MTEKKMPWQLKHEVEGYKVQRVRGGQIRAYGPTIDEYTVKDLTGERTENEIRRYCTEHVLRADDPKKHDLIQHLISFTKLDDGSYRYVSGHDYTG